MWLGIFLNLFEMREFGLLNMEQASDVTIFPPHRILEQRGDDVLDGGATTWEVLDNHDKKL